MNTFSEFWPYYLSQHKNPVCRWLHFTGTTIALFLLGLTIFLRQPAILLGAFAVGYGCSWTGHFVFEKNRPATFQYPLWSFLAEFRMYGLMWIGRL